VRPGPGLLAQCQRGGWRVSFGKCDDGGNCGVRLPDGVRLGWECLWAGSSQAGPRSGNATAFVTDAFASRVAGMVGDLPRVEGDSLVMQFLGRLFGARKAPFRPTAT